MWRSSEAHAYASFQRGEAVVDRVETNFVRVQQSRIRMAKSREAGRSVSHIHGKYTSSNHGLQNVSEIEKLGIAKSEHAELVAHHHCPEFSCSTPSVALSAPPSGSSRALPLKLDTSRSGLRQTLRPVVSPKRLNRSPALLADTNTIRGQARVGRKANQEKERKALYCARYCRA